MRFTETFARSSARYPWRTLAIWAVVLVVGIALSATLLADALSTTVDFTDTPEAKEAALIVAISFWWVAGGGSGWFDWIAWPWAVLGSLNLAAAAGSDAIACD